MSLNTFISKVRSKIWRLAVSNTRKTYFYSILYRSFWHSKLSKSHAEDISHVNYYTAVPNYSAGIGHQLANWIAGYWYARRFGLRFSHTPFSTEQWEFFFGFGEDEISTQELIENHGYKRILLPLFDESKPEEFDLNMKIISSYSNQKVVFVAEQDQPYQDQYGVIDDLKRKFYSADSRKKEHLIYSKSNFNIAMHIRRGDIVVGQTTQNSNLQMRWQDDAYFEKVLKQVIETIKIDKPIVIFLFSQGSEEDFAGFRNFENVQLCLSMGVQDSFLHMVFADLLITSKSSFSYKPALLNKGIKVCPDNFWHNYPDKKDWILVGDDGDFDRHQLLSNL